MARKKKPSIDTSQISYNKSNFCFCRGENICQNQNQKQQAVLLPNNVITNVILYTSIITLTVQINYNIDDINGVFLEKYIYDV